MSLARVSVLIVTWNCRALVGSCLDYLTAASLDRVAEIIIFDNASSDGTAEWVRLNYQHVVVIKADENLGFGRANNLAAKHSTGDYLLLLNPDAYLTDPKVLGSLCAALDSDWSNDVASVAPMLVNHDGSHQIGDGGYAPTIGNVIRHQWLISKIVPGTRGLYVTNPASLRRGRVKVEWLAATCLLIRRAAFEEIGGFDPAFFMYGEDVDLGVRIHRTGRSQFLLPGLRVLHLQGATQRQELEALHVSFGWIDAIFAQHQGEGMMAKVRRHLLAASMSVGFVGRAGAYYIRGGTAKADAMWRYARYSWKLRG